MGGHTIAPNPTLIDRYPDVYLSTGLVAENHARESGISRDEQDAFALRSHQRAIAAIDAGRFADEIVPVTARSSEAAERPRPAPAGGPRESVLRGRRRAAARHVARGAGQTAPGLPRRRHRHRRQLVADQRRRGGGRRHLGDVRAKERGLTPLGRFVAFATAGVEPERFGIGPVPAIRKALKLAGLTLDQIDLVELNEAFAAQVLACLKELPIDPERLNVNGGAIALGHPLGCTGAKLTTTLLYEMKRRNARYGLVTMCVGGGMGAAGIFEEECEHDATTTDRPRRPIRGGEWLLQGRPTRTPSSRPSG